VQSPLDLPALPDEVSYTATTATFDVAGMQQLKRYRIASETNKLIAISNAAALQARNNEVIALQECSEHQRVWTEIREEMLQQERQDHFADNWFHRGLIALGILVSL